MEGSWILVCLLICSVSAISRRHRSTTPFIDSEGRALFEDEQESDLYSSKEEPESDANFLEEHDPCLGHFCDRGRVCRVDFTGNALCECQPFCPLHRKLTCGTDGRLYLNHCELHRTACIQRMPIRVDRRKTCFRRGLKPISWNQEAKEASLADDIPQNPPPSDSPEFVETLPEFEKSRSHRECSLQQYEIMKDNLLLYEHAQLMAAKGKSSEREYLVGVLFSHLDVNNNGVLEKDELEQVSAAEEDLHKLSKGCDTKDLIRYDDVDNNGLLSLNEFYTAFSKLYSVSVVSLDKDLQVNHLSARVGDNLEIKCDVTGTPTPPIVWRRNGRDLAALNSKDIRVIVDGSLYLTGLQLVHAGNYTCHADRNKDVVQTHVLTVYTVPNVQVTPHIQSLHPGQDASMSCRASGEPFPKVEWLKNDEPLRMDIPHKYEVIGNGTQLLVRNVGFADTGAYMCQATSLGGMARDISSLVVQENPTPTGIKNERQFFVFHDWGIAVYEPEECRLFHVIQGTDVIPGTQEYVCGDKGSNCSWGRAVNVAQRYIYASQPTRDRVLVISIQQMVVVDVIVTDQFPVQLSYVSNLNQVWVLNWRSTRDDGIKTIQVIRDASEKKKHHTVHPEPIDGHFDLVKDIFVPAAQDLGHEFRYAYVTHTNQRGLYKLDLANMKYVKTVDLTPYNCVPHHLAFSSLHGLVIMQCIEPVTERKAGQLIIDYLTDAVLSHKTSLTGRPYVTPDSLYVITVDTEDQVKIVVQRVTEHGLDYVYDVSTSLNISDITFFPSMLSHAYDLYASSTDKNDILFLNLKSGKVEMITGVGKAMNPQETTWGNANRDITSAGIFGHYMVSPSENAVFVMNGETKTVNCEIGSMTHPRFTVWASHVVVQ